MTNAGAAVTGKKSLSFLIFTNAKLLERTTSSVAVRGFVATVPVLTDAM